ncbi:protein HHL1, chloroplastic-like isoform X1 [Primulina eburnea]|uniref:protein HHL1, chloroplastic-like isoform X1 n=1 Tax=Primulina eburnea TaxID=1245227 RepID=UPI003C6C092A
MEAGMYLNQLVKLPLNSNGGRTHEESLIKDSLFSTKRNIAQKPCQQKKRLLLIRAKGKKGMDGRQYQRKPPPPLPKLEDDGNPKFVIFIRMANVYLWYPLNIVSGGATAKVIVAAKDTFVGKYIYKDTLARNLAAVIYKDEKEMQKMAIKQFRVLRSATEFKYGYKLIENNSLTDALAANNVIELPSQAELKTVFDKVKDFFGDARESFGKMTFLNSGSESAEEDSKEKSRRA